MSKTQTARYAGGTVVEGNGSSQNVPGIPDDTTTIWICARGGDVYATLNDDAGASPTTSPMHAADGTVRIYGPFFNVKSLAIYADADVFAHITFEAEKLP